MNVDYGAMCKRRLQRIKADSFKSSFEFTKATKISKWKPRVIKLILIFTLLCMFFNFIDLHQIDTSTTFSQ